MATDELALGDEVAEVLSLSGLESDILGLVWELTSRVQIVDIDAAGTHIELNETHIEWRTAIILLGLVHQFSDLDLKTYVNRLYHVSSSTPVIGERPNLATENRHAYQNASQPQSPCSGVEYNAQSIPQAKKAPPPVPRKPANLARHSLPAYRQDPEAPVADGFEENLNNFGGPLQEVRRSSIPLRTQQPLGTFQDSGIRSLRNRGRAASGNEKFLVESAPTLSHNILDLTESYDDGLIPVEHVSQAIKEKPPLRPSGNPGRYVDLPSSDPRTAPIPLGSSQSVKYTRRHTSSPPHSPHQRRSISAGLCIDPPAPDPRISPIPLISSPSPKNSRRHIISPSSDPVAQFSPALQRSELELIQPFVDSRSDPTHFSPFQRQSLRFYDHPGQPPQGSGSLPPPDISLSSPLILERESSDITAETQRIVKNRLIALKEKESTPKSPEIRKKSIFGRKSISEAPVIKADYPMSVLAIGLENAAMEGYLPLVATFIAFGADSNLPGPKSPKYATKPCSMQLLEDIHILWTI